MAEKNPFGTSGAGANAFKAAYDRLKAEADLQRKNIGQDYASAYQQLRQQGYGQGLGAAAQAGLSGGQAQGVRQQIGAQQMGALGNLMQGQERALREQKAGEASIYSNALLEGQQAQQYEREGQQYNLQREQQAASIISNKDLTDEQKNAQLNALGYNQAQINNLMTGGSTPAGFNVGQFATRTFTPFGSPVGSSQLENAASGFLRSFVPNLLTGGQGSNYTNLLNFYDLLRNFLAGNLQPKERTEPVTAPNMSGFKPPVK